MNKYILRLFFLLMFLISLAMACKAPGKLTKKEQKIIAQLEKERRILDSIASVRRADSLAQLRALARLDSIRVADSLAAIPKINYDTVLVASLLRTPCFGKCPNYEIRLYASGYATFEGIANVPIIGRFEARVDQQTVESVIGFANKINYFSLSDRYPTQGRGIEDFPLCVTFFRQENLKKIIYNRNDAPADLVRYEKFFDTIFEGVAWERIGKN